MKKITQAILIAALFTGATNTNAKNLPIVPSNQSSLSLTESNLSFAMQPIDIKSATANTEIAVVGVAFSGQQSGNEAVNAFDNNTGTRWAHEATSGTTITPAYITFDLDCEIPIENTQIMFFNNGGTTRIYRYKIATSTNGTDFTDVVSETFSAPATNPASY